MAVTWGDMNYFVARNGQTYGPYSLETVRKYLSEGSILPTDMARTDSMSTWTPLSALIDPPPLPGSAIAGAAPPPPAARPGNPPPSIHWAIVFLLNLVTSGLFILVWVFIQSSWVKTIDPTSRATRDYVIGFLIGIASFVAMFIGILVSVGINGFSTDTMTAAAIGGFGATFFVFLCFMLGALAFHMKAVFGIRDSLVRYYNTVEPINLRLSSIMTFFFNIFYFQYHFTRIAEWKRTGILQPQR